LACAALCAALMLGRDASAASIAWVSFHAADNTPSAGAAGVGATTAPDKGYTDLLTSAGHTVTRIVTTDNAPPAGLDAHDVIIISRSVPSGHYQTDTETAAWNAITKPIINLGGYIARTNRLGMFSGNTIPDTTGNVKLNAVNPAHPIFTGIVLNGGVTVNDISVPVSFNGTPQRGISSVTEPIVPGGQVIATINAAAANGNTSIAFFPAGTTMVNDGNDDVLAGRRLLFLTGSREHDGAAPNPASSAELAGIYDLTPTGAHMFLNAVTFMQAVPEPSTAGLAALALGGLGLVRRKRA
jgi:hypothetical protein